MMALRRIFSQRQVHLCRNYATGSKLVDVTHNDETGITVLSMSRTPVNSLNLELLAALKSSIVDAKKNGSNGLILTSSLPTVFTAGLDIMEMYKPDIKRATEFWQTLQDTWSTLYGLDLPVAAAINGASPAGGCLLAITCEYRVFVEGKHSIGLNETRLGIIAPKWFRDLYIGTLGYRTAEISLLRGSLFQPKEALQIGLVDELAVDKSDAIKKCEDYILSFKNIPAQARGATKMELRKETLTWLKENREQDLNTFLTYIQLPKVQTGLKMYIESLKQKAQ